MMSLMRLSILSVGADDENAMSFCGAPAGAMPTMCVPSWSLER